MITYLLKLADYLDSNNKTNYANHVDYAITKISQIEEMHVSNDSKIENAISNLSDLWIDLKLNNETDFSIYDVRNDIYSMLKNHSDPKSLLGEGWSVQQENDQYVLVNPDGKVFGDEGPEDPIFNVAIYLSRIIEDKFYRDSEFEEAPTEEIEPDSWQVPEPHTLMKQRSDFERSLNAPTPGNIKSIKQKEDEGLFFEFPEHSEGMHSEFNR